MSEKSRDPKSSDVTDSSAVHTPQLDYVEFSADYDFWLYISNGNSPRNTSCDITSEKSCDKKCGNDAWKFLKDQSLLFFRS